MRRTARILIAVSTIGGLTSLAAPQAALAATQKSLSLGSHINKVHTSTGKTLKLSLTAFKNTTQGSTDKVSASINLSTGSPYARGETHAWRFQLSRGALTYSSGSGSLNTHKQLGKYGSVDLTFNRTGQSTSKCSVSGSNTIVKGRLHGAVHFDSNTKAWGSVNDKTFTFDTPNFMTLSNGCNNGEGGGKVPCFTGRSWSGPPTLGAREQTYESGFASTSGNTSSNVTANRTVILARPSGASRTDVLNAPAPVPAISGKDMTIKTKSSGPVSGSAKISGSQPTNFGGQTCYANGHKKTQQYKGYTGNWSSPKGLRFNFKASGDLVTATSGSASWSQQSFN